MFYHNRLHKDESGQTALETAIILIAFVVVASVFAFTILSAGQASTQKGEQAIYAGLKGVQSSMQIKGSVMAQKNATTATVDNVVFTLQLASGGDPIDLTDTTGANKVVIGYRDQYQALDNLDWAVTWVGTHVNDPMLEANEQAEVTVDLTSLDAAAAAPGPGVQLLGVSTPFTLEIKPPTGSVIALKRTTPAALDAWMELR